MAGTATVLDVGWSHITYQYVEDGNAEDTVTQNVLTDLTNTDPDADDDAAVGETLADESFGSGAPLYDFLNQSLANQAAARDLLEQLDVMVRAQTLAPNGATAGPDLSIDANVSSNAFRLEFQAFKAANADQGTWIVKIKLPKDQLINIP